MVITVNELKSKPEACTLSLFGWHTWLIKLGTQWYVLVLHLSVSFLLFYHSSSCTAQPWFDIHVHVRHVNFLVEWAHNMEWQVHATLFNRQARTCVFPSSFPISYFLDYFQSATCFLSPTCFVYYILQQLVWLIVCNNNNYYLHVHACIIIILLCVDNVLSLFFIAVVAISENGC